MLVVGIWAGFTKEGPPTTPPSRPQRPKTDSKSVNKQRVKPCKIKDYIAMVLYHISEAKAI